MTGRGAAVAAEPSRPARPGGTPAVTPQRSVQLPVPGSSWVTVQADFPLSEEAWAQMITLLNAMKPGLVAPAAPEPDED